MKRKTCNKMFKAVKMGFYANRRIREGQIFKVRFEDEISLYSPSDKKFGWMKPYLGKFVEEESEEVEEVEVFEDSGESVI